jgi:hypothetical protein
MFKTCPSCGDEFVPHVELCPDCRVPLRAAGEHAPAENAALAGELREAVMLRAGEVSELRELAERLTAAGIPCAIDTDPPGQNLGAATSRRAAAGAPARLALYVDANAAQAAVRIHQAWMVDAVPDSGSAGEAGVIDACPGCGEPLTTGAAVCASCGLEFPELQVACPRCGQGVEPAADHCGHCGYRP